MSRLTVVAFVLVLFGVPLLAARSEPGGVAAMPAQQGTPVRQPANEATPVSWPDAVRRVPAWVRESVRDRYIVTLRDGAPDPGAFADELAHTHGLIITHVYRAALWGFSAYIPPPALALVKAHPFVAGVEPVREFKLAGAQTQPSGEVESGGAN